MLAASETIVVAILERNSIVTQLQIVLDITGWLIYRVMKWEWDGRKTKVLFFNINQHILGAFSSVSPK